jgi:arsenate reductase
MGPEPDKIVVHQKPTCSKCRSAIRILKDRGVDFEAVNYYEVPLEELGEFGEFGVGASQAIFVPMPIRADASLVPKR